MKEITTEIRMQITEEISELLKDILMKENARKESKKTAISFEQNGLDSSKYWMNCSVFSKKIIALNEKIDNLKKDL